jgi:hypothetical protein
MPSPMPPLPPVTIATLLVRSNMFFIARHRGPRAWPQDIDPELTLVLVAWSLPLWLGGAYLATRRANRHSGDGQLSDTHR